LKNSPNTNKYR